MQARLKVLHDKANVKQVKLLPVTLIGRSTECNLKIASSQVSRNHCRITLGTDAVFVEDLGSANGTLVDGQLIPAHQPTAIAPGSRLVVGPAEFQVDFVLATSSTVVLPRTGVAPVAELPTTEMNFPLPSPLAPAAVPPPAAVAVAEQVQELAPVPVVAPVAIPVAVPLSVAMAPDPPTPVIAQAAESVPQWNASDTVNLEPGQFEMADGTSDDSGEATLFMFQQAVPETIAVEPSVAPEPDAKRGGLKSLFSMFGRKEKPVVTHSNSAPAQPAAAPPSVFLPAVEPASPSDEEVPSIAEAAVEPAPVPETSEEGCADEEDGFQQFLSQL
ncbi:MAG: FHA domain-containing protein [Planctomycetes bacterium]|nr:FHA domain-containing protein [Planctomycetota bacterium]